MNKYSKWKSLEAETVQVEYREKGYKYYRDIWDEYCRQCGVKCDREWFDEIKKYELEFLSKR